MKTIIRFLAFTGVLFFLCAGKTSNAQTSTQGTDFWMGFSYDFQPGETGTQYKIWISSISGATGIVSVPLGAWSSPFTVAANSTTVITIPYAKVQNETSESVQPKGVHIISSSPVSVSGSEYSTVRTEATLVMPTSVLGTEYYVLSYPGYWYGQSHFEIVATQKGTTIQITPASTTMGNKAAGTPFTITLDSGQVYLVRAKNGFGNPNCDMTGTKISGTDPCKPFAVFGGAAEVDMPIGCGTADPLYEQLLPVNNWGKEFIIAPFFSHTGSIVRIVASQANTSVVIDGAAPIILNAGQFNEQAFNGSGHCITSDKPIEVAQFMKGNTCSGGTAQKKGDPDMLIVNSTDQFMKTVTFRGFNHPSLQTHYVNVVMKTAYTSQLKLDAVTAIAASPWTAVPSCSGYSYAAFSVTNNVTHTLAADSGFVASVYGYGSGDESYSQSLGFSINTSTVNPTITGTLSLCSGTSTTLTATGGGTYLWAPGGETTASITVSPTTTTTYTVSVSNGSVCSASGVSTTAVVTVSTCGINVVTANVSMCKGECKNITATASSGTAPYTYLWSPNGTSSNVLSVCPTATTTYTITSTDATGATGTAIAVVSILPTPVANFTLSPSNTVTPNSIISFTDMSTGGGTPSWNFGDPLSTTNNTSVLTSPSHTYSNEGNYCITLISSNSNSCADTTSKCIEVFSDPKIIIPNVFTPNNDDNNDWFYFETKGIKELTCTIYDRWGLKMAEWNTVSEGWDGRTPSGKEASNGVYYYIMKAVPINEKVDIIEKQGFLQLLRQN